jgi:UDP-GlcNAc:undecaprenyl-phosphate GlcNAc-1-phosphate transferase
MDMFPGTYLFAAIATSFGLALTVTLAVRTFARHRGIVAQPKADRWHKKPTAMLGGVAIFASVLIAYALFVPPTTYGWVVISASAFLFAVGLVDDFLHIKPYQKLIGQVMGATLVVYYGLQLPWTGSATINMALTIFWLIGITNALNLLDNMDGLAAGVAAIAAIFLAASFHANGQQAEALMLAIFAAVLLGFLVYNFNPASIFMGDCGSLFIGFFLASAALMSAAGGRSRSLFAVLGVPILILFIPIFDTTLVTIVRKLFGRAASQGGRDHTSHRLVALGLSERRAVLMLYGFAALSGTLALLARDLKLDVSIAVTLGFTVILTLLGVYLARVQVYDEEEIKAARERAIFAFLVDLSYKRRIFEVLLDLVLIILAYYSAYAMMFGPFTGSGAWRLFLQTLPIIVFVKMAALLVMGVYRGIWRYTSLNDLVVFAKAIILGSVASVLAILGVYRFAGFSRAVFALDGLLLFLMLAGSRLTFRLFRRLLPAPRARQGRRVLIYGAGDAGELLLREILNNPELNYAPIGFVDDDPLKKGKVIHGLPVFGGNGMLGTICKERGIEEVLISSRKISEERVRQIKRDCEEARVKLKRLRIQIEQISDDDE